MKKTVLAALVILGSLSLSAATDDKPIVIITQDGEVDDRSTFMRFLLYTADMDLRGVIATNSKWQKNGHGLEWIKEAYGLYGQVRKNLLLHNADYPSVEFLQSITVLGNENPEYLHGIPPYADSKGSDLIINELLSLEDKLININCWGGVNTVAHCFMEIQEALPDGIWEEGT